MGFSRAQGETPEMSRIKDHCHLWCHPTISFSVTLSPLPSVFPSIRVFPMSWLFTSGGQSIEASALTSVLPMSIEGWFPQIDWMAPLIQWTWTWANSRRWWGTGKAGMLQSMGSQRVGYNLATEKQQSLVSFNDAPCTLYNFWSFCSLFPGTPHWNETCDCSPVALERFSFPSLFNDTLCVCSISLMCGYWTFCSERKCLPPCIPLLLTGLSQLRTDICVGVFRQH